MKTVIKVMESLVKLNNYEVERFDIQSFNYGNGIEGYTGYLFIKGYSHHLIIRHSGSFEWSEN